MTSITRKCDQCGNEYSRKPSETGKYCSRACYQASKVRVVQSVCGHCGQSFSHRPARRPKFCSPACAASSMRNGEVTNCQQCGAEYRRSPALRGKYCSPECARLGRRREDPSSRRRVYAPGHPLIVDAPYVEEHRLVLFDKIGPGAHPCHYCGTIVEWAPGSGTSPGSLVTDHVDRNPMNNDPGNLVPSCQRCNIYNAERPVADDESYRVRRNGTRLRGEQRKCERCGNSFTTWGSQRPGRGRFCSRSCARRKA